MSNKLYERILEIKTNENFENESAEIDFKCNVSLDINEDDPQKLSKIIAAIPSEIYQILENHHPNLTQKQVHTWWSTLLKQEYVSDNENQLNSGTSKLNYQSSLKRYFLQNAEDNLFEEQINFINHSLLKAFIVGGIPYSVIETLFFIDLLQTLCPNYQPPSRDTLAG
ncbi:5076_t:CDS:2 [Gigaspora margarita]|uniref:5076_t:CDS:1 n=1 Tax=Gigaspora margarita TaxID=4874 RepID=A0ABM8W0C6_GIGMA|nr:5076_t:CDS:2 [Gigaspora margarita]